MRIKAPPAFSISFDSPDGTYSLNFRPTNEWDRVIEISICSLPMLWSVERVEQEQGGFVAVS
jgi:hypothetical protein